MKLEVTKVLFSNEVKEFRVTEEVNTSEWHPDRLPRKSNLSAKYRSSLRATPEVPESVEKSHSGLYLPNVEL